MNESTLQQIPQSIFVSLLYLWMIIILLTFIPILVSVRFRFIENYIFIVNIKKSYTSVSLLYNNKISIIIK